MVSLFSHTWVHESIVWGYPLTTALLVSLSTLLLVMKVEGSRWFLLGAAWKISGRLLSSSATARAEPVTTLPTNTASGSPPSTSPSRASPRETRSRQDSSEAISADVKSVWRTYRSLSQYEESPCRAVLIQWSLLRWLDNWVYHVGAFFNLLPQKLNGNEFFKCL